MIVNLTVRQSFDLRGAINHLDATEKDGGKPLFRFPAKVRLSLAKKIRHLTAVAEDFTAARKKVIAELGVTDTDAKDRPAVWRDFDAKCAEMLDQLVDIELGGALMIADLDLDKNDVPAWALAALDPILQE